MNILLLAHWMTKGERSKTAFEETRECPVRCLGDPAHSGAAGLVRVYWQECASQLWSPVTSRAVRVARLTGTQSSRAGEALGKGQNQINSWIAWRVETQVALRWNSWGEALQTKEVMLKSVSHSPRAYQETWQSTGVTWTLGLQGAWFPHL